MKKVLIIISLFLWSVLVPAQTLTTTAGTVSSCAGEVTVPVTVTNFTGVASISLVLNFNSSVLTWNGYQNFNSALTSGMYFINSVNSKVIISWTSVNPVTLPNDTLIRLKFITNGGTGSLTWDTQTQGNCEYSNYYGTVLTASFVNGAVNPGGQIPVITSSPVNASVLLGSNASFQVIATGASSYLWQKSTDNGTSWTNVTNVAPFSGATGATLTITGVVMTMSGYRFRCQVGGTCPPSPVTSDPATLTVVNLITVTAGSVNSCPGSITIPVSVTNAIGVASISLALNYNNQILTFSGVQNINSLFDSEDLYINASNGKVYISYATYPAVNFGNSQLFQLLFSYSGGNTTLSWDSQTPGNCEIADQNGYLASLTYVSGNITASGTNPVITGQPVNSAVLAGNNASFSVTATGATAYIWQKSIDNGSSWSDLTNTVPYSGVTTATMTITSAGLSLNGVQFRSRVTGACPPTPVISNPATLTVYQLITVTAGSFTSCPGTISIPISVAAADNIAGISLVLNYNQQVLTFQGYQNLSPGLSSAGAVINAANGKVYFSWASTSGVNLGSQQLVIFQFSSNGGTSALTWDTQTPGYCEFVNAAGNVIASTYINGNVSTAGQFPVINLDPSNTTVIAGTTAYFSVSATGATSYQWQVSTNGGNSWSNVGGNSATLSISLPTQAMSGFLYHCIVGGACPPTPVTSGSASLTVLQMITTTAGTVNNSCGTNILIPVTVTNCNNVGSISLALNYSTSGLTYDGYQDLNQALNNGNLVVNASNGKVYISWASINPVSIGTANLLKIRFLSVGITSSLTWDTQTAGNCEYADGQGNIISSSYINGSVTLLPNPLSVNAGNDVTITLGSSANLSGSVSGGTSPYTYLWSPATGLCCTAILNPVATPDTTTIYTLTATAANGCSGSDIVKITVLYPPPIVEVSNDTAICLNESVSFYANATGATPPYHYLWSTGATTQTVNISPSYTSNIYVSVTDLHNSLTVEYVHVQVYPLPVFSLGNDTTIATGQTLFLTPGSSFTSYLWSDGSTGQSLLISESGTYAVTVTNQYGCSYSNNINVTVAYLGWVVNIPPVPAICSGSSAELTTSVTGGTAPYFYVWSNGATSSSVIVSPSFSSYYYVTVTDANNSSSIGNGYVVVHPVPQVNLGNDISFNFGESATLDATQGFSNYLWNTGATVQTIEVNQPGIYSVTVTNQYGCSGNDDINITVLYPTPVVNISNDTAICLNGSASLYANAGGAVPPYHYLWSTGVTTQNVTVSPVVSSTYYVSVTDYYNSLTVESVHIQVNPLPVFSFGNDTTISTGQTLLLTPGSGYSSYLWNNGSTGQSLLVSVSGTYAVTVTNQNGCWYSDNINVTIVNQGPVAYIQPVQGICSGSSVILTVTVTGGTSPYIYLWNNGETGSFINVSPSSSSYYYVTVTDAANYSSSGNVYVVVHPLPMVSLGNDISFNEGGSATLDAGQGFSSYLWSTGASVQTIVVSQSGIYSVTVTNQYGCSGSDNIQVTVTPITQTQAVNLPNGWSIISTYIIPVNPDITVVFSTVTQNLIIAKSGSGTIYWPQFGVNNIGSIVIGEGYQIKMNQASNINVTGTAVVPELTPITIPTGWSILGYLKQSPANIETMMSPIVSHIIIMKNGSGNIYWPVYNLNNIGNMNPGEGYQIKLTVASVLTFPAEEVFTCGTSTITDYDGNSYNTIQIGSQCWMKENLKTTHNADGTALINWFVYANNVSNKAIYGLLYTWSGIMNGSASSSENPSGVQGACPIGWHIPSVSEWNQLVNYLGGYSVAGNTLKEAGTSHWNSPNYSTNESGFTALPGGYRSAPDGFFLDIGGTGYWWSATEQDASYAWDRYLYNNSTTAAQSYLNKMCGFSVRCTRNVTVQVSVPSVTTETITAIGQTSATGGGNVTSDGGAAITARGVCWNLAGIPTTSDSHSSDGTGTGNFTSSLTGLSPNTAYHVRAYATNSVGTAYGDEVNFATSPALPVVTTYVVSSITQTTASSGGEITSDGGAAITARGVCWNTTGNPTVTDSHTTDGTGTGIFTSSITGLSASTPYYVKAYAINIAGTAYGSEISFTTSAIPSFTCGTSSVLDYDSNSYNTVQIGNQCWMKENMKTIHYSDGSAMIDGTNAGNINENSATKYYFAYNNDISNKATYGLLYTWAAAMNGASGSIANPSGVQGVCPAGWHIPSDLEWKQMEMFLGMTQTQADEMGLRGTNEGNKLKESGNSHWAICNNNIGNNSSGFTALPGGSRLPDSEFIGLTMLGYWWTATEDETFYPLIRDLTGCDSLVDRSGSGTSDGISVRCLRNNTSAAIPAVTTSNFTVWGPTTVTGGGEVTSDGGVTVIARGVCWNTTGNPTISDIHTMDGMGTGVFFSSIIDGISGNTTYHVRAYATNSVGTAYGNELTFTTSPVIPVVTTSAISAITQTTATGGGEVISDGGATVTARGVCWNTSGNPTITDSHTTDGTSMGSFASSFTGLTASTTYYVRAYATNSIGIAYGSELQFSTTAPVFTCGTSSISDFDGNTYYTVQIGTQCWMKENLKTTHYADGTALVDGTGAGNISGNNTAKYWFVYDNNISNKATYGLLYTWAAAMNGAASSSLNPSGVQGICPAGWHLPGDSEWKQLEMFLGMNESQANATGWRGTDEGGKLKVTGTMNWVNPNTGASNSSGFTALPGGYRYDAGVFSNIGNDGYFWSATEVNTSYSWDHFLGYNTAQVNRDDGTKSSGFSVRCTKDN
ncbi:MAG: hypothetical protein NTW49_09420 [Bacteroidia bacterium]|nr:hypothetical protein [Bacteroidia bacterium]